MGNCVDQKHKINSSKVQKPIITVTTFEEDQISQLLKKIKIIDKNNAVLKNLNEKLKNENKLLSKDRREDCLSHRKLLKIINKDQKSATQEEQVLKNEFNKIFLNCPVCYEQYNLTNRIPYMICSNQHTYCQKCVCKITRQDKTICPECREDKTLKRDHNLSICNFMQNTYSFCRILPRIYSEENCQNINLTVNMSESDIKFYEFFTPNRIIKTKQSEYHDVIFKEVIPFTGKYRFYIKVAISMYNLIYVGITNSITEQQKWFSSRRKKIQFLLGDEEQIQGYNNFMDYSESPVASRDGYRVIVQLDMDESIIRWIINGQLQAFNKLDDYVKTHKHVPFLKMVTADDIVTYNH